MKHHWTPAELEHIKTHELAEWLSNVVLLLRRLPNVPMSELGAQESTAGRREHSQSAEPSRSEDA
jgi:hypothetical protein